MNADHLVFLLLQQELLRIRVVSPDELVPACVLHGRRRVQGHRAPVRVAPDPVHINVVQDPIEP